MKRSIAKLTLAIAASFMLVSFAQAQYPGGVVPFYGGGGFNTWGAGSTPMGSYMTGAANAIRAEGEYNLNTSAAAINLEEATKRDIENRTAWTKAYFEMRRVNDAYTHPKKPPVPQDTWARLAHEAAPSRLNHSVLDPVSGQIVWPSALLGDEFKPERDSLEKLFANRALSRGAIGAEGHAQIRKTVDSALAKLKSHIRTIDSRNYLEARNFLNSLGYESTFAAN